MLLKRWKMSYFFMWSCYGYLVNLSQGIRVLHIFVHYFWQTCLFLDMLIFLTSWKEWLLYFSFCAVWLMFLQLLGNIGCCWWRCCRGCSICISGESGYYLRIQGTASNCRVCWIFTDYTEGPTNTPE